MANVFASAEVMYYLHEIVVRIRQHPAFIAGLTTDAISAFETAAKFVHHLTCFPSIVLTLLNEQDCCTGRWMHVRVAHARAKRCCNGFTPPDCT